MKTLLGMLSLAVLAGPAVAPPVSSPAAPLDDEIVLELGREGLEMLDLLETLNAVTGRPVLYAPTEVGDLRLFGAGDLRVPAADLRDVAEALLSNVGFLLFDEVSPVPALRVQRVNAGRNRDLGQRLIGQFVSPDRLDETPPFRGGLYTTIVPLEHLDARSAMATFQPMLDGHLDSLRNVEQSNALVMTSSRLESLRHVAGLVALADQPRLGETGSLRDRVSLLERQLAELSAQVAASAATAGDQR